PRAHLFGVLALGDVARDARRADHPALGIANRRDVERDAQAPAGLRDADGFQAAHDLAAADAREHLFLFGATLRRQDERDRLAERLRLAVAEEPLGALIPGADHAVERAADDGVAGGLDDRREARLYLLGALLLGDVDQHVDRADDLA